jgi:hypothetical protein
MKIAAVFLFICVTLACAHARPNGRMVGFEDQVVSLYITHQRFDDDRPWAKRKPGNRVGVAVVVDGQALLTTTQMIQNATLVQVERFGDGRRWDARVVHSDTEINLALVTVSDPTFFEGLRAVRFAPALPTEGFVRSVRWKNAQLETPESRVTRLEVETHHANVKHVFLKVRTDVESGGWSEPVFRGGAVAGLTSSQENRRAAIIPPEILRAYVETARGDDYRGFADLSVVWQSNRDAVLAAYLGLEGPPRGVVIRGTRTGSSECGVLRPRDVLLSLDGHEIDAVGNYQHPVYGRIRFTHIAVDGHRPGDVLTARVLRGRKIIELPMQLRAYPSERHLIPWRGNGTAPPYLVAGGFVFRELNGGYITTWGNKWKQRAPFHLTYRFYLENRAQTAERQRVVIISSVLSDAYNLGYHDVGDRVVENVNGLPVDSIADVQNAFASPRDGFHIIGLAPNGGRLDIVLDAAQFSEATARILADYGISEQIRLGPTLPPDVGVVCEAGN